MKLQIQQEKLMDLLNYLEVESIFPFPVLTMKKGKIKSIQKTANSSAFRYVEFEKEYFRKHEGEDESIKIDAGKVKKLISAEDPKEVIVIETSNGRMFIQGKRAQADLPMIVLDQQELKTGLPFQMKEGVPFLKKGTVPLDTCIKMGLTSFKDMVSYASVLDTEFFRFAIDDNGGCKVKIGDLEAGSETVDYEPDSTSIEVARPVDVVITRGIKELSKTFTSDVGIRLRTGNPVWFFETTHQHKFGVMIPHYKMK